MVAGLISRVIGLLYRSPMSEIIGSLGMGYYTFANNVYIILLLVSSYSIPMAIAKVVSERLALKQYRNAYMVFKGALLYGSIVGAAACAVAVFGGRFLLAPDQRNALLALQILGPTIFLSAILGVFRGYFQAYNNMVPTSISQVMEQIANAIISVLAAWVFVKSFATDETSAAIYGAAGGTLGTGGGVLFGLLFMLFVYAVNKNSIKRQVARDRNRHTETLGQIMKIIILMVTPVIFSTFVYNANVSLNGYLFSIFMGRSGMASEVSTSIYGEFGYYTTLIGIPLALSSATSSSMLPEISARHTKKDIQSVNEKIHMGTQLTMFICIPAAVGLGVLAYPIMSVLFPKSTEVAGNLLVFGAVSIIFTTLSTITNGVLQAIGKPRIPLANAGAALIIDLLSLVVLLWFFPGLSIYGVLIVSILFAVIMCILNQFALQKYLGYRNQFIISYAYPLIASAAMGAIAWIFYYGLYLFLPIKIVCLGIGVLAGVVTYLIMYVKVSKTPQEEMRKFPFGNYAVKFLKVIRIYK